FYGTILGIFFTAFFLKNVQGRAVFVAAVVTEAIVLLCFWWNKDAYLWYNPLGCGLVMGFGWLFQYFMKPKA
ncbi:MAG: sodium:solute symporter, partial [Saprospiraceae bacterium]|nr:sodium:solute symporter [Saprospiraceae bacterium]